ncbi:MAG: hypothetical protein CHACPFDD_02778 [Phycisphaerae bacterium]|nr:hypothetical protein [Phycisphaerae bacterium]
MKGLRQLEAAVERDARWLRQFPDPVPPPGASERLVAALASHRRGSDRAIERIRPVGAIAAALLLGVGLLWQMPAERGRTVRDDPAAALRDWSAAVDDSTSQVDRLVTHAWLPADGDAEDADAALDDAIKSLDATLELGA